MPLTNCAEDCVPKIDEHRKPRAHIWANQTDTTNHSPSHILTNAIQRLHFEESSRDGYVTKQDSAVEKLCAAIPAIPNTKFSAKLVAESSTAYQSHLERISDYLSKGPDVWWKPTQDGGFEFLDGEQEE